MKKIVVIPNVIKDSDYTVTDRVITKLCDLNFNVCVDADIGYDNGKVGVYERFPDDADLIVVIGGDGSVIDASAIAIEHDIPILGVNLGRMGYLTEIEIDGLSAFDRLISGEYGITEKMLLSVSFEDHEKPCERFAVNDIAISRDGYLHIADINVEDSIGNVVKIRSDGVILATPQGSTAYSFSAGGPIVAHDVESILLTPVSPHSFFGRSVIFNSNEVIKVTNAGMLPLNVNVDGRRVGVISQSQSCVVSRALKTFKMLTFEKNSMFSSLFRKMRVLGDIES